MTRKASERKPRIRCPNPTCAAECEVPFALKEFGLCLVCMSCRTPFICSPREVGSKSEPGTIGQDPAKMSKPDRSSVLASILEGMPEEP